MPAIYSFSLDHKFDHDIIVRLEGMKNRSSWIRTMLRRELDYEVLEIMVELLYDAYSTQVQLRGFRKPNSLYQFKEQSQREWAIRAGQQVTLSDHPVSHNSSQEQE
jgi:hypothetical protein